MLNSIVLLSLLILLRRGTAFCPLAAPITRRLSSTVEVLYPQHRGKAATVYDRKLSYPKREEDIKTLPSKLVLKSSRSPSYISKRIDDRDVVMPVLALIFQNSGLILMMRYTMLIGAGGGQYIVSTAVFMCEILKFLVSTAVIFFSEARCSLDTFNKIVWKERTRAKMEDTLYLALPAFLYIVQNNLQYLAVANLSPAVFQVLYQFKIVTAAIFSVLILRKRLLRHQWASIILLMAGLAQVQLSQQSIGAKLTSSSYNLIGVMAVALASLTSGLAGVLVEKLLKGGRAMSPLWLRNMQMSMVGSIVSAISLLIDKSLIQSKGLFGGYNVFVWSAVLLQTAGGLIVSLVVKRSDNLVKGFATSMSILLSCFFSSILFKDVSLSRRFLLSATVVILSTFWYGWTPRDKRKKYSISRKYW